MRQRSARLDFQRDPARQANSLQSRIQGIGGGGSGEAETFRCRPTPTLLLGEWTIEAILAQVETWGRKHGKCRNCRRFYCHGGINGRKMQGFGNPNSDHGPKKQTMMEKMVEAGIKKVKK